MSTTESQEPVVSDEKKRAKKSKTFSDPSALKSGPQIKKYIIVVGKRMPFVSAGKTCYVERSSNSAVSRLQAIANNDNKRCRSIIETAVRMASNANKKTIKFDTVRAAEEQYDEIVRSVSRGS